jgi:heme exporter protein C
VQWWNTLHQPDSITLTAAPAMPASMLLPLLVTALGFTFGFAAIVNARLLAALMEQRLRARVLAEATRAAAA